RRGCGSASHRSLQQPQPPLRPLHLKLRPLQHLNSAPIRSLTNSRTGLTLLGLVRFTARGLGRRPIRTILTVLGLAALILTYVSVQSLISTLDIKITGSVSSLGEESDVWQKGTLFTLFSKITEYYANAVKNIT